MGKILALLLGLMGAICHPSIRFCHPSIRFLDRNFYKIKK